MSKQLYWWMSWRQNQNVHIRYYHKAIMYTIILTNITTLNSNAKWHAESQRAESKPYYHEDNKEFLITPKSVWATLPQLKRRGNSTED